MDELSHVNPDGSVSMVDVSAKPDQVRVASARHDGNQVKVFGVYEQ